MNSGVKIYRPIRCAVCKVEFQPLSGVTKYCAECRPNVRKKQSLEYSLCRQNITKYKPKPVEGLSWAEISRICNEHNLSYGKAKARGLLG